MQRGYIVLWRCIRDNHFWQDKPFDRCRAWIDLLMMANHTPGTIRARGISIAVDRGQVGTSEVVMAEKWGWSRGKVRRLLKDLREQGQIVQQNNNVTSLITIVNYDTYQLDGTAGGTAGGTADGQQTDSRQYPKKEFKNEDNKPLPPEPFCKTESFKTIFNWFWSEYASSKGKGRYGNKKLTYEKMARTISSIDQARIFAFAVKNYWAQVDKENENRTSDNLRALKLPEVFVNSWQGYIPEDVEARLEKWKKEKESDRPPTATAEP